jgi:hypothetical protein
MTVSLFLAVLIYAVIFNHVFYHLLKGFLSLFEKIK